MLDDLSDWAVQIVEQLGYVGVALLVAVENVFPPIPSEVVLGLAGYTGSRGDASVVGMIAAATIGSMVGAFVLYGGASIVGPQRVRAVTIRYGAWVGVDESDLDRAEAWFDRRSRWAVLLCRCVPLIRSLISVPAGFRRMPLWPFALFTLLGSLVWNTVLVMAGYLLGEQWERLLHVTEPIQNVVVMLLALAVVMAAVRALHRARRAHAGPD